MAPAHRRDNRRDKFCRHKGARSIVHQNNVDVIWERYESSRD
jgi:hypothetical protein